MNEPPTINLDILSPYLKERRVSTDKYDVEIDVTSGFRGLDFNLSMIMKEPHLKGAFPNRRISLERHDRTGHDGVHIQLNYHLIENPWKIGSLHLHLDIKDQLILIDVAEGFLFTIVEILQEMGAEIQQVIPMMFNTELIKRLEKKKDVLIESIRYSFEYNSLEIMDSDKGKSMIYDKEMIKEFIQIRGELTPLLGSLIK